MYRLTQLTKGRSSLTHSLNLFSRSFASQILSWGRQTYGGRGIDLNYDTEDVELKEVDLMDGVSLKTITAGWLTNVAVTNEGFCLHWGFHRDFPKAMRAKKYPFIRIWESVYDMKDRTPVLVGDDQWQLTNKIVQVSAGGDTTAFLTINEEGKGQVFCLGENFYAQAGWDVSLMNTRSSNPRLVPGLENHHVTQVACGFQHMLILTSDGQAWACGRTDLGSLGIPSVALEHEDDNIRQYGVVPIQTTLREETDLETHEIPGNIIQIAAGMVHSAFLCDDGSVWTCGDSKFDQCGHGDFFMQLAPMKVAALKDVPIAKISCGQNHTVALSRDGRVFTWGLSRQGQCGRPASDMPEDGGIDEPEYTYFFPGEVDLSNVMKELNEQNGIKKQRRIASIFAGFHDTALVTNYGETIQFGSNCERDGEEMSEPRIVFPEYKVREVAFGMEHGLLLVDADVSQQEQQVE